MSKPKKITSHKEMMRLTTVMGELLAKLERFEAVIYNTQGMLIKLTETEGPQSFQHMARSVVGYGRSITKRSGEIHGLMSELAELAGVSEHGTVKTDGDGTGGDPSRQSTIRGRKRAKGREGDSIR